MSVLSNPRHESFAQALAKGKTADEAYALAGYRPHRSNASRMSANDNVRARLEELQGKAAKKVEVTVESLAAELEEARLIAIGEKQSGAAVQATMGKAKLFGLIVDKKQHSGPNGGPIPFVDLTKASDEQLAALESILGPLAGTAGDDAEGDPTGEGPAGS